MADVSLTIHGRVYRVTCEDGQESHLLQLAAGLDRRVRELAPQGAGDARALVLASLVMADELHEAQAEAARLRAEAPAGVARREEEDLDLALRIERLAQRLETLADDLEAAA